MKDTMKLRQLTRTHTGLIWKIFRAGGRLDDEDALTARILEQHPEYYDVWERADGIPPDEEVLRDGANPFVHVTIHQVIENQIANHDPAQTGETLEALMRAGYTRHEAIHAIGRVLTQELFEVMRDQRPFNKPRYVEALRDLARTEGRPGRPRRPRRRR